MHRCVAVLSAAFAWLASAGAQCNLLHEVVPPLTGVEGGVDGAVLAIERWDPDGAGPLPVRLVAAGTFQHAGVVPVGYVATFDAVSGWFWNPVGLGVDDRVDDLTVASNGDLIVAGEFGGAFGGPLTPGILRRTPTGWAPLGTGLAPSCKDVLALPNGELIATGSFVQASGNTVNHVARWNGSAWLPLGTGLGGAFVMGQALARLTNGDLVVAGAFTSAGGVPASDIARWNGTAWSAMPGLPPGDIGDLAVMPNGDLVAAPFGANALWRWNGTAWSQLAALGGTGAVRVTLMRVVGTALIVGGTFTSVGGVPATHIARWDGVSWQAVGTAANPSNVLAVCEHLGQLYFGGGFTTIGSLVANGIARWTGTQWEALGAGIGGTVRAQAELGDGRLVIATHDRRVLRRDGAGWTQLGGVLPSLARTLAVLANGDLVAGGSFPAAGPTPSIGLLRWDGFAWQPFATPLSEPLGNGDPYLRVLHALPDGSLLAGGRFTFAGGVVANSIARWDGSAWTPLQAGVLPAPSTSLVFVAAIVSMPNGDLAVSGTFGTAGGVTVNCIARWDGSAWSAFGPGLGPLEVAALAIDDSGALVAGGGLLIGAVSSRVARWNGSAWTDIAAGTNGMVFTLATLPGGDLVAGGLFTTMGGVPAAGLARWDGSAWSELGGGVASANPPAYVDSLQMLRSGRLAIGGSFDTAGGAPRASLALLASTCPASVAPFGAGCAGSGGTLQLAVADLPWVGSTLRTVASGLTPGSLLVRVLGVAPAAVPLASLHPAGGAGCTLWVAPLVLEATVPPHGAVVVNALAVPNSTALVGFVLGEQMVEIEVDAAGAFARLNASNALAATIGHF